jgi:YHS domain-containing protein
MAGRSNAAFPPRAAGAGVTPAGHSNLFLQLERNCSEQSAAMKSIVRLWVLAICFPLATVAAEDHVPWAGSLQTACELAAEQRRLVLLHFYNDNCAPCVRVEQNVFSQPQVGDAVAQNYIPLKVHAGKSAQLAARYQVQRWPTDVIVTPSGLEVYRAVSPQNPADYVAVLNRVAAQTGTSAGRQWSSRLDQLPPRGRSADEATTQQFAASPQQHPATAALDQFQAATDRAQAQGQPISDGSFSSQWQQTATPPAPSPRSSFVPVALPANPSEAALPAAGQQSTLSNPPLPTENPWLPVRQPTAAAAPPLEKPVSSEPTPVVPQEPTPGSTAVPPVVAPPSDASARVPQSQAPPVALDGCCPVTLLEKNILQKADPQYGAIHDGQTYLFVSPAEQQRFLAEPNRYVPPPVGLEGFCPVTLHEKMKWQKADRKHFAIHRGRMYFFAAAAERERFLGNPDVYAPVLSGCDVVHFALRSVLVEGKRAYGLMRDNQIFLFADEQSLKQFENSPGTFAAAAQQAMLRTERSATYR